MEMYLFDVFFGNIIKYIHSFAVEIGIEALSDSAASVDVSEIIQRQKCGTKLFLLENCEDSTNRDLNTREEENNICFFIVYLILG